MDLHMPAPARKNSYPMLMALLVLFCARVLGQMAVECNLSVAGFHLSRVLPPVQEWQSGLLPYPLLLTFQVGIIVLFTAVCRDFKRSAGIFFDRNRKLSTPLMNFAKLYLVGNSVRLIVWMTVLREHHIWYSGFIPIIFHYVLATFLLVVARHHRQQFALRQTESKTVAISDSKYARSMQ